MSYPRYTIEVRMLKETWIELVPDEDDSIIGYDEMSFKEKAEARIRQYNDINEFPKEIVSYVAKSSITGKETDKDNFYGLAIDPDGDLWKVGYCDHKGVVGWDYNNCEDWVLTVNPSSEQNPNFCIRLVPNKVSEKALKKAIQVVKRSKAKKFIIETMLTNKIYDDIGNARNYGFTKAKALEKLAVVNTLDIGICGIK